MMKTGKKRLYLLLGICLITQATTSIVGGMVGVGPFTDAGSIAVTMDGIVGRTSSYYAGIFLQIITALVIVALAMALYQAGKGVNKTAARIAVGFYLLEVVMVVVNQMLVFGIIEASHQYAISRDTGLLNMTSLLFSIRRFGGAIAMMPFALGALVFYYLIMKAGVIPKWLGLWGLITIPLILVGWSLAAFGVDVPYALYVPYVPWEWVAGIYILVKGRPNKRFLPGDGAEPAITI